MVSAWIYSSLEDGDLLICILLCFEAKKCQLHSILDPFLTIFHIVRPISGHSMVRGAFNRPCLNTRCRLTSTRWLMPNPSPTVAIGYCLPRSDVIDGNGCWNLPFRYVENPLFKRTTFIFVWITIFNTSDARHARLLPPQSPANPSHSCFL